MLAARALSPIDQVVANWRTLSAAVTAYDAIREPLRDEPEPHVTHLPRPHARLTLQNVGFAAPGRERPVLSGVSFEVAAGQAVGVIGLSGAGKTSLLQMIANARNCDQGDIRLDGARYGDWDSDRLGRFIGYMPQDCALFPGSIRDNISRFDRWGGVDSATIDHLAVEAAKEAGIHELILGLPKGYDTELGPRGRGLSAGQQQRLALARALYGSPMLYVFDEPNSNADAAGEMALLRLIAQLKAQGAIIVMAVHRRSLIGAVDLIAQLGDGRLERFGPRDKVIAALEQPPAANAVAPSDNRAP